MRRRRWWRRKRWRTRRRGRQGASDGDVVAPAATAHSDAGNSDSAGNGNDGDDTGGVNCHNMYACRRARRRPRHGDVRRPADDDLRWAGRGGRRKP